MNSNKSTFFFLTIFCSILWTSCDPAYNYSMIVENKSAFNLQLIHRNDTVRLDSESEYEVFNDVLMGRLQNSCFTGYLDSLELHVWNNDSLKVLIDPSLDDNWKPTLLEKENRCECWLTINNQHVQ